MCLAKWPQRSDAGVAWTRGPSVSSQALYHWATALPTDNVTMYITYSLVWWLIACSTSLYFVFEIVNAFQETSPKWA